MRRWNNLLSLAACAAFATPSSASTRLPGSRPEPVPVVRYTSEEDLARSLQAAVSGELASKQIYLDHVRVLFNASQAPSQGTMLNVRRLSGTVDRGPLRFELTERGATPPRRWAATLVGRLEQDTLVATRPVVRGAALECGDFQVQRRPWSAQADQAGAPCTLPSGAVSRRFLAVGDALRADDVGEHVAVAEMASVTIKVAVGQVLLESQGVALENGNIGQRIRVRPGTSRQTVYATVTGPGSVTIDESGATQ
jgi:flagella basal body P-ring formation protein FlgA